MTVLVGILASDGAAIAADRQVTVGHVGLPMLKIAPIGGDSLIASSGSLALGQKIRAVFETHHAELKARPYAEHLPAMEQAIRVVVTRRRSRWRRRPRYVIPGAENNALACSLACIPFADGLRLCHVDWDGSIYCLNEIPPLRDRRLRKDQRRPLHPIHLGRVLARTGPPSAAARGDLRRVLDTCR